MLTHLCKQGNKAVWLPPRPSEQSRVSPFKRLGSGATVSWVRGWGLVARQKGKVIHGIKINPRSWIKWLFLKIDIGIPEDWRVRNMMGWFAYFLTQSRRVRRDLFLFYLLNCFDKNSAHSAQLLERERAIAWNKNWCRDFRGLTCKNQFNPLILVFYHLFSL